MDQLIEELIFTRLCVNKNNNLEYLKKGLIKSNLCKCNLSNHIACVFYEKNKSIIKLNVGINNYNKNQSTIHAEISVFNKLKTIESKKCKKINILILKVSNTGLISNSKPCLKCIEAMTMLPITKGYMIRNVFYSDNNGNIIKNTLYNLVNDENKHLSRYYKKNKK